MKNPDAVAAVERGRSWPAGLALLGAAVLAGCASAPWRLEISNLQPATGVAETFRFSPRGLTIRRKVRRDAPTQVVSRRKLTEEEAQRVLSALGLFHQARLARSYRCRGVTDGEVLEIAYVVNSHRRRTSLQNVYIEPVETLIRDIASLLPEDAQIRPTTNFRCTV